MATLATGTYSTAPAEVGYHVDDGFRLVRRQLVGNHAPTIAVNGSGEALGVTGK